MVLHDWEKPTYHDNHFLDLSSVDLIVNSTNMVTMNCSSAPKSKMIDSATLCFVPDADLQFDVVSWTHTDFESTGTPPYSHDIYAIRSPSVGVGVGYSVDLNDIEAAFDCDISTLDTYLHSTPCSNVNTTDLTVPQSSFEEPTYPSAHEHVSSDIDPVEEFFPSLCETTAVSAPKPTTRQRTYSSGTICPSVSRYSPYTVESTTSDSPSEYRIRRDKNNLASQRSRQKRAEKLREMKIEREVLERRNIELKTLLSSLEVQVADYKRMVLMVVSKQAQSSNL
ncbi:Basic region leucine zipper [Trichostrongylus colubriformis]|uniref:Basic region leucine zipper n=1 Tax=Trichostrongylus colubriformis TaxID=6319 RepID=A0AAN8IL96_TRICO